MSTNITKFYIADQLAHAVKFSCLASATSLHVQGGVQGSKRAGLQGGVPRAEWAASVSMMTRSWDGQNSKAPQIHCLWQIKLKHSFTKPQLLQKLPNSFLSALPSGTSAFFVSLLEGLCSRTPSLCEPLLKPPTVKHSTFERNRCSMVKKASQPTNEINFQLFQ